MTFEFTYDENLAVKADEAASRLSEAGAYVGTLKQAWATESQKTGTQGIEFVFEAPGSGTTSFTLWTHKSDGTAVFGANFVNAMMYLFGLRTLKAEPATVEKYDEEAKGRVEVEGEAYPALYGKPIGCVFEKELYSKNNGATGERLNLVGVYQPETKLMVSELKEKKTQAVKLERLLKSLKVKDSRKKQADEPSQPGLGGISDGF